MIKTKEEIRFPVISERYRGKWISSYSTSPHIYTVDYENKGDKGKTHQKDRNNQGQECTWNLEMGCTVHAHTAS